MNKAAHYVYLYRDERGRPRYVGYGERPTRASAHLIRSHNPGLADFLSTSRFTVEIAGAFGNEETGRAIETALISALNPEFNAARGPSAFRFRPLGVPEQYAERLTLPPILRQDFFRLQGESPMPVLFVYIGERDSDDGRPGYDPANPPGDKDIQARVEKYWQLQASVPKWAASPPESPGLLIGVHGSPGSQIIIAALFVDRESWGTAVSPAEAKIQVPLRVTPGLDAFDLRCRRIDRSAGIAFEGIPAGFFVVLNPDGTSSGGRRTRRAKGHSSS